ncbi:GRIP domain-containing protein RUD3 [Candida viswanathii]|uniref:GRIP domain-containing protein RUD3 n=1 Tax=Candida viswanathii TaxID=5486 RepID=A0A367XNR4_9ASCO|nr:GRIP domain-containing protein RUD3 [Candida viswanathii]
MGKNKKKLNSLPQAPKDNGNETNNPPNDSIDSEELADKVAIEDKQEDKVEPSAEKETNSNGVLAESSAGTAALLEKLKQAEHERDEIQQSYDNLVSKISSMKTIFTKLKQSESELEEKTELAEKLTTENETLKQQLRESASDKVDVDTIDKLKEANTDLNNECEKLSDALTKSRREYTSTIQELQDEKYELENQNSKISKKLHELKQEINELSLAQDEMNMEQKSYISTIDELKEKLASKDNEISEANKTIEDLKTLVSVNQTNGEKEITSLNDKISQLEESISSHEANNKNLQEELTTSREELGQLNEEIKKIDELRTEVHNKLLQIGKLRHEAIILNEHLTKALTMLKQGGENGSNKTIDKELISNVLISFLQFPRGDTKKFEALNLIGALLEWDELQKVLAGLTHLPNLKNQQTKLDKDGNEVPVRQSFVSLWTEFLEKESSGK